MADLYGRIRELRRRLREAEDPLMLAYDEWRAHALDRLSRAQVWAALHPVEEAPAVEEVPVRKARKLRRAQ